MNMAYQDRLYDKEYYWQWLGPISIVNSESHVCLSHRAAQNDAH